MHLCISLYFTIIVDSLSPFTLAPQFSFPYYNATSIICKMCYFTLAWIYVCVRPSEQCHNFRSKEKLYIAKCIIVFL